MAIERLLARCRNFRIDERKHGPAENRHFDFLPNYSLYGVLEQQMMFEKA